MVSIADRLLLTRGDLLNFPKDTVDLILEMQKDGWRGHRNSHGHVKMLAPDGKTHVMATSNKNSATYVKSGYNQYKKKHGEKKVNSSSEKVVQKWPCARPGCPKVYASEQQLSDHIMVDHEKKLLCPEKDCHEVRDTKQKLTIHMTHAHGYVSPRKAQRKKQEANRAALAKAKEQAVKDEEQFQKGVEITKVGLVRNDRGFGETAAAIIETGKFLEGADESTGREKLMDYMSLENIVPDESRISLKGIELTQTVNVPDDVFPEDIYRETKKQLVSGGYTDKVDFIDERDSWTLDLTGIMDMPIGDVARVLHAAGLRLEMRSWKE